MIQSVIKTKVVGVDIGYELTTYAIVDVRGNIYAQESFATTDFPNVNAYISELSNRVMALIDANGGYESIRSMGVSMPNGNYLTGNAEDPVNMPWKGSIPVSAMLRDRTGLAVAVGNNAHVKALGEAVYGCAHGMQDFLFIVIGHGLGSCLFSHGKAYLGTNGFTGEIGHCCIVPDGRPCSCGNRGCLEAYCSTRGIIQTAQELMAETDQPSLMRDCDNLTPEFITKCCDQGDEMAIEVYRKTGFLLGWGLANYASIVNPEAIIMTGDILHAGKWLMEPVNDSFEEHVFHNVENKIKLMPSTLKDDELNLLGASALAWRVKEYSLFK